MNGFGKRFDCLNQALIHRYGTSIDVLDAQPDEPKGIDAYKDSVFMNAKTRDKFHVRERKTYQFRIRQAGLWGKFLYFMAYPGRHDNLSVLAGVVGVVLGVLALLGWTLRDWIRPHDIGGAAIEQTFYAFYGDLDKSGTTSLKNETVVLTQSGQSSRVHGKATGQRGVTWLLDGHRVGDHMVLTEIREPNKDDPFPTAAATYYLQTISSSYSGTITYWDRCLLSVVACPIILSSTNMDVDPARKLWPSLFNRQCTKLDLAPDSKEPTAQTAPPSCPNPAPKLIRRSSMLLQQVAEGFIGELLEVHHSVTGKQVEGVPRLIIELDSLARHLSAPFAFANFYFASR
jgi:hypothetical protein